MTSRDLLTEVRELLKVIRLTKHDMARQNTAVPSGALGVLAIIAVGRGCHGKDLAAECALDPSTVSRAVAALVKAGLVARTADPDDGRASVLTATEAGRRALEEVLTCYDHRLVDALRDWTAEELRTFTTLLHRFTGDLKTTTPTTRLQEA
ncbi:MAG: MarR family transcriptional regulator, partial [Actinoplanes sp.]